MIDWTKEFPIIKVAAEKYGVDAWFVKAIRAQESGRAGREFGVMLASATDYASQLRAACATVRDRLYGYDGDPFDLFQLPDGTRRLTYARHFISRFASIWAPVDVDNDPHQLNRFWYDNVLALYQQFLEEDWPKAQA